MGSFADFPAALFGFLKAWEKQERTEVKAMDGVFSA